MSFSPCNGELVDSVKQYSDALLIFLLKGANPAKFRDNSRIEHAGGVPVTIVNEFVSPPDRADDAMS